MRFGLAVLAVLCGIALAQTSTQPIQGPYPTLAPAAGSASPQTMSPIHMPSPGATPYPTPTSTPT